MSPYTPPAPVDLSKFADVHVLNMAKEPRVPTGYVVLGVFPGQYLAEEVVAEEQHVFVPFSGGSGTGSVQSHTNHNKVFLPVATSFMLVGRLEHSAVADREKKIMDLERTIQDLNIADREKTKNMAVVVETLTAEKNWRETLQSETTRLYEERKNLEALTTDLRKKVEKITQHFGKKAVEEILGVQP